MIPPTPIDHVRMAARRLLEQLAPLRSAPLSSAADFDAAYAQLAGAMDACLHELAVLNLWGSDNRLPSSELWNVAGQLLERGWLQNRARTKPRGYAGDHELLAWIYHSRVCDDPLGRLFDRYFQEQAAPQAVRNRLAMISDWIVLAVESRFAYATNTTPLHVAIMGTALGLEVRDALLRLAEPLRQQVQVTLLDLDPAAIDFGAEQLAALLRTDRLVATTANLFRLPARPQDAAPLNHCDLLFCPGLFDYLADAAASRMLQALYERLAPGGRLTVFQFAPANPTRGYMEWFGNWYLTYRDQQALRGIVEQAELLAPIVEFGAEPLGIDLFVHLTRQFG
jgi:extracellular factor (EF) 3-hydroxypalmitic acid methyl ester biosynthesis protein